MLLLDDSFLLSVDKSDATCLLTTASVRVQSWVQTDMTMPSLETFKVQTSNHTGCVRYRERDRDRNQNNRGQTRGVSPVTVQVQCERFYIKPYNSFVLVSVPVLETARVIKPLVLLKFIWYHLSDL